MIQHAQTIERGGLHPQTDGTKRQWFASLLTCDRVLCGGEITFGANHDEDRLRLPSSTCYCSLGEDFLERFCVRLNRSDQPEIVGRTMAPSRGERLGRANFGKPV